MIIKNCLICKKEFKAQPRKNNEQKCCSWKCGSAIARPKSWHPCKQCGILFHIKRQLFCNKKCANKNLKYNYPPKLLAIQKDRHNSKNPNWKGKGVGYGALHSWVLRRLKRPTKCDDCKKFCKKPDLANISQKYKRDLNDWEWLCRKCHMTKDGRLKKFFENIQKRAAKGWVQKSCPVCTKVFHCLRSKQKTSCSQSCGMKWVRRHKKWGKRKVT